MPWYYAGPDAQPVGPISLEELQSRRAQSIIGPETYVIEQTTTGVAGGWRHYRDLFPQLPPPPPATPAAHPLFPSAAPAAHPLIPPAVSHPAAPPVVPPGIPQAAPHGHYPARPTNACCGWGFALGLTAFLLAFICGTGLIFAIPSVILCILGLVQLSNRPMQSGRGYAISGLILAVLGLLISACIIFYAIPIYAKQWPQQIFQHSNPE